MALYPGIEASPTIYKRYFSAYFGFVAQPVKVHNNIPVSLLYPAFKKKLTVVGI